MPSSKSGMKSLREAEKRLPNCKIDPKLFKPNPPSQEFGQGDKTAPTSRRVMQDIPNFDEALPFHSLNFFHLRLILIVRSG